MQLELFRAESSAAIAAGQISRGGLDMPPLALSRLEQNYFQEKKSLAAAYDAFCAQWREAWHALPKPQAALAEWSAGELCREYIPLFADDDIRNALLANCRRGLAFVWTIGPALEHEAAQQVGASALQGMFLDVAGSLLLSDIRCRVREFVADTLAEGESLLCEHIPEISETDKRLLAICAPWRDVPLADKPAFSVSEIGVIQPLKSQCAMYLIGRAADIPIDLVNRPCSSCKGSQCLYLQFGGCHLPDALRPMQAKKKAHR